MKKVFLILTAITMFISCDSDDYGSNPDNNTTPINETSNEVQLRSDATFGQVMTNSEGFTLYFFAPDSKGLSNCSGGCIDAWPVFNASELTLDQGLDSSDFATITREDGTEQTTYKGWPLYLFGQDTAPGDINGDGSGGVWYVAKPDYSIMVTRSQLVGRDSDGNETNLTGTYEPGEEQTTYMTDANGNTLYLFINDKKDTNNFTNEDFSNNGVWPIFQETAVNIPSIFNLDDFGSITVFGETQMTYKGWPVYTFGGDENRGDNFGVGFPVAGVWPILNNEIDSAPEDAQSANEVQLRNDATFGQVMTNSEGFTLYFFAPDSKGLSNCSGGCIDAWPVFNTSELTLDQGLDSSDFATITREDGTEQTTYKGWPLYLFGQDAAPGDINGDGAGGVWYVAKPDYSIMVTRSQLVGRDSDGNETDLTSTYEPGEEQTTYMTDANGNTLYLFINDKKDTNNFTNEDFSNNGVWPIFQETAVNIPSIFNLDDFGSITVFGETQMTYKGWPVYTFGGDENRGDNFGVGFPVAGVWPILNNEIDSAPEDNQTVNQVEAVFQVGNIGAASYTFDFTNVENPELELTRGKTYEFKVNTPGHPFLIKTEASTGTDNTYNDGITNNGTADGTLSFTVPSNAPNVLFYNCEFHGTMTGRIRIVD